MVSPTKIQEVENIQELLQKQPNFILIKFDRTAHQKLEELRKQLKNTGSRFKVVKNALLEKAINKLSSVNKLLTDVRKAFPLRENTALLTLGEKWDKTLSDFSNFNKEDKTLSFKIGLIDGQVISSENLIKIANLPSKDQLIANVIGSLKAPITNTIYAMKYNMQKLVYVLKAKSER